MMKPDQPAPRDTVAQAADAQQEAEALAQLAQALESALTPRQPRESFATELRAQLVDESANAPLRLRNLSPRLQVAAALALATGCLLLMLRRLLGGNGGGELVEDTVPSSA
ncbi:MAG: hypothetical protein OXE95_04045 [Chloroflexi bacterium]|nr:hypothetical protein [Chloroflexota bacterium]MCY4246734.1 hypothetical protein [Chloroflexota bacterium]